MTDISVDDATAAALNLLEGEARAKPQRISA
jgi:hypothetical protein